MDLCSNVQKMPVVCQTALCALGLTVLMGFVARTASSYYQGKCVERRSMNVIFQNGAMERPICVQMMYTWKMEFPVMKVPTATKRDVMTAIHNVSRFLAKGQRMKITIATKNINKHST